jgi:arylsulfatase A-like enzyme
VLDARTATHKLIRYHGHNEWTELFDVANDPYETKNLADDAELMAQLQAVFDQQSKLIAFRMPKNVGKARERPGQRGRRARQRAAGATP